MHPVKTLDKGKGRKTNNEDGEEKVEVGETRQFSSKIMDTEQALVLFLGTVYFSRPQQTF